jgi:hypothetical protein
MRGRAGDEVGLIEFDETAAQRAGVFRVERAVDPLQDVAGEIEVAVVNIGTALGAAAVAAMLARARERAVPRWRARSESLWLGVWLWLRLMAVVIIGLSPNIVIEGAAVDAAASRCLHRRTNWQNPS